MIAAVATTTDGAAGLEVRDNAKNERNTRSKTLAPTQGSLSRRQVYLLRLIS
jgi:hypothetical protein